VALHLHDIGNAAGRSSSPYGWRVHEALHLLSLPYETERLGLTEIHQKLSGRHKTVPVLVDGEIEISDSWAITSYLAEKYDPDNLLFGGADGYSLSCFVTGWVDASVIGTVYKIIVKDIYDGCRETDQAYLRAKEEKRFGQTLEELYRVREAELPGLQKCLHPARQAIRDQPFLGGDNPTYADIVLHSIFRWTRVVSDFELLRADDRLQCWIKRMDDWATKD
jgi:glutathione S-transferase